MGWTHLGQTLASASLVRQDTRMRRLFSLPLLLLALPAGAQEPAPGEWVVPARARYAMSWSYTYDQRTHHTDDGPGFRKETREVQAELLAPKALRGEGALKIVVQKVTWTVATHEYTLELQKASADAAPTVSKEVHDSDADAEASQELVEMQEYVQATYRLKLRTGLASIQVKGHDGWAGGASTPSVFNRCYFMSDLPDEGALKSNRRWIDERETEYLPLYAFPGKVEENPKVKLRLQLGSSGVSAKGSGSVNFKGLTLLNWKYAGKSSIKRSFKCAPSGVLAESSEEAKSAIHRTNQTKPGKSGGTISSKQTVTVTPLDSDQ